MRLDTIVAYTYAADIYCPDCTINTLRERGGLDEAGLILDAEAELDQLAEQAGIDRMDEATFDSGDFPKVVFLDQCEDGERCGSCGVSLTE